MKKKLRKERLTDLAMLQLAPFYNENATDTIKLK